MPGKLGKISWAEQWARSVQYTRRKAAYRQKTDVEKLTSPEEITALLEKYKLTQEEDHYAITLHSKEDLAD